MSQRHPKPAISPPGRTQRGLHRTAHLCFVSHIERDDKEIHVVHCLCAPKVGETLGVTSRRHNPISGSETAFAISAPEPREAPVIIQTLWAIDLLLPIIARIGLSLARRSAVRRSTPPTHKIPNYPNDLPPHALRHHPRPEVQASLHQRPLLLWNETNPIHIEPWAYTLAIETPQTVLRPQPRPTAA